MALKMSIFKILKMLWIFISFCIYAIYHAAIDRSRYENIRDIGLYYKLASATRQCVFPLSHVCLQKYVEWTFQVFNQRSLVAQKFQIGFCFLRLVMKLPTDPAHHVVSSSLFQSTTVLGKNNWLYDPVGFWFGEF